MRTKIRTSFLAGLLFFGLLTNLQAQDKYEFAVIQFFHQGNLILTVSINGEKYEEVLNIDRAKLGNKTPGYDVTPALRKVNEMQDHGWELYDQTALGPTGNSAHFIFYMRKKKVK